MVRGPLEPIDLANAVILVFVFFGEHLVVFAKLAGMLFLWISLCFFLKMGAFATHSLLGGDGYLAQSWHSKRTTASVFLLHAKGYGFSAEGDWGVTPKHPAIGRHSEVQNVLWCNITVFARSVIPSSLFGVGQHGHIPRPYGNQFPYVIAPTANESKGVAPKHHAPGHPPLKLVGRIIRVGGLV